ncbi:alpha/beta hydrolase [Thermus tengchongensis]|uniref:Alpha/beta hydrolase n=1 Tax=Thermus tengchongensis TaxID=1214928 RepID=A0ABY2K6N0_9DEIN|nr:alpha/beta fold hydrolase [Thermus tengchongensis]TFU16464.1 alpha/beta hydrolase [Thermus tengchongensis]
MNLLLLHGFTSHSLLALGPLPEVLRKAGFGVSQPTLPGHGTRPEDLLRVRWRDWLEAAQGTYPKLPEPKGMIGLSMGALLALMRRTPEVLPRVQAPALVEAERDRVVAPAGVRGYFAILSTPSWLAPRWGPPKSHERTTLALADGATFAYGRLGSPRKEYLVFPENDHDLLLDREQVAQAARDQLLANSNHLQ